LLLYPWRLTPWRSKRVRPINRAIGDKPVPRRTRRTAKCLLLLRPPPGKLRTIPRPLRRHHRLLRILKEARLLSKDSNRHRNQGNKDNGARPALRPTCKTGRFRSMISRVPLSRVIPKLAPVHPGVLPIRLIQTAGRIRTTKRLKFLLAL
jgi:hypothetical protein